MTGPGQPKGRPRQRSALALVSTKPSLSFVVLERYDACAEHRSPGPAAYSISSNIGQAPAYSFGTQARIRKNGPASHSGDGLVCVLAAEGRPEPNCASRGLAGPVLSSPIITRRSQGTRHSGFDPIPRFLSSRRGLHLRTCTIPADPVVLHGTQRLLFFRTQRSGRRLM
jgi:hypothetical protein